MSKKDHIRVLDNWVDSFLEYTSMIPSPRLFRKWAAYSAISGALERRTWIESSGRILFPNTIVLLVSKPGVGKTNAIDEIYKLLVGVGNLNVSPDGMTKAALIDQLLEKQGDFTHNNRTYFYHSLLVIASEFGTLLPEYDKTFLNVLNKIYDCEDVLRDKTRQKGTLEINRPQLNMIAGTQPSYLGDILPDSAYGMGFTSRCIMIYAGELVKVPLFTNPSKSVKLGNSLLNDLKSISGIQGRFKIATTTKKLFEEWHMSNADDAPNHPKLLNYIPRRIAHVMKLAMASSIANGNELLITDSDFNEAKSMLLHAESLMPQIFKEMTVSVDAKEIHEIHSFMFSYCNNTKSDSVPEHQLTRFMMKRVPVNRIQYFMESMLASKMIKMTGINLDGKRKYVPLSIAKAGEED